MKIGHKLILGYLLVASVASLTTYTALRSYQNIDAVYERLVNDRLPQVKALEELKASGFRIVSSTTKPFLIDGEESQDKEDLAGETAGEQPSPQLTVFGYDKYEESLKRYENLTNASSAATQSQFLEEIRKNGDELKKLSRQLIEMKKEGVPGEKILKLKEKFEDHEVSYFQAVDAALNKEYEHMVREQIDVHETVSNSTRTTYLISFLTFILAIGSGVYIYRWIADRLIKLKEVSEKVGRGDFEMQIEIQSSDEIGDLSVSFNKMVGYLKASHTELSVAKDFTDKILNSMVDFVVVLNMDLTISLVNKAALQINGYEERELIGQSINILIGDRHFNRKDIDILREKGHIANLDRLSLNKDGSLTPVSMSFSILEDEQGRKLGIVCVGKDVSERQRVEMERQIIAEIIQSVFTTSDLEELFNVAHQSISKIISAENCFIALHNPSTKLMHYDYWVDKFDSTPEPRPVGKGFSSYILKTGKPLLLTEELKKQLCELGEVQKSGSNSLSWIGVPLKIGSRTIGVLAVQDYEKDNVYSERDLKLLAVVSDQLALAIERKQTEIELKASEARLNEAQRSAKIGGGEWDLPGEVVHKSSISRNLSAKSNGENGLLR